MPWWKQTIDHDDMPTLSVKHSSMHVEDVVFEQTTDNLSTSVQSTGLAEIIDCPPSLPPSLKSCDIHNFKLNRYTHDAQN